MQNGILTGQNHPYLSGSLLNLSLFAAKGPSCAVNFVFFMNPD
ncbi:hypothetical protein CAMGR0001_1736 [Campylobacter gracilis RM3268]|uniref:Uncharacterized protein n=1 Tax=Campylobacter gracilis RM3268 TaxID=553220 RepID=C8PFK6_9BACT|nr:hypothetical protein CAMGR0001_1736 [Campylobacter gracilis RM3268]